MSVEERGKDEQVIEDSSTAELSPSEPTESVDAIDTVSAIETTTEESEATESPGPDNDTDTVVSPESPAQDAVPEHVSAEAGPIVADESDPLVAESAQPPADAEPDLDTASMPESSADAEESVSEAAASDESTPVKAEAIVADESDPLVAEAEQAPADAEPDVDTASMPESSAAAEESVSEQAADDESTPVEAEPVAADESDPLVAEVEQPPADAEPDMDRASMPESSAAAEESVSEAPALDDESSAPETAVEAEKPPETPTESAPAEEESRFKRGQVYHGIISSTTPTAVNVDLGEGDQGVVPGRELELMTRKMLESLTVGAEIDVYVVNPRNHRGETVLSINHALEEMDWRSADEYAKSKAVYEASIGGYNKGGLIVRFGRLRGFVPQSQLAEDRVRNMTGETPEERYGPMVNQPIGVKVMEVDRHRNRLILSERAAFRESRQLRKEALIAELTVGEIRKGTVVSLENFGAFVDIGGGEGLIHLSELAWGHITHPRQAVTVGDEVEVEVISINPEAKRIGLSRRRVIRDPWDEIATALRRGQLVRSRITKLTKFGAFARLIDHEAVEGLIHISELSGERVTHPREVVKRGDEMILRIVKIDIKERRLGLSLKSVNSTEFLDLDWEMAIQESATPPQAIADAESPDAQAEAEGEDQ